MRLPTPPEIANAPELAMLASVHDALELLTRALVAANPGLVDQEQRPTADSSPMLGLARRLILHEAELRELIELYADRLAQLGRDRGDATGRDDACF